MGDIDFLVWIRHNTKEIEDSEDVVYKGSVYTKGDLHKIYVNLKETEVDVFGYNQFFKIQLRDDNFLTLEQVVKYVSEHIIDTASVVQIKHKKWLDNRDILIVNPNYKPPTKIGSGLSDKYLKKEDVKPLEQVLQIGEGGADIEMVVLKNTAGIYFVHFNLFKMVENVRCLVSGSPMQCFNSVDEIHFELGSQMAGKKVII